LTVKQSLENSGVVTFDEAGKGQSSIQYLRLETTGRKTGNPHAVLLRFITFGSKIIVFPSNSGVQSWFLNVQKNSSVRVFYGNKVLTCDAMVGKISGLDDPLLSAFTRKYGRETVNQHYLGQHSYVQLIPLSTSAYDLAEVIYGDLEAAFDGVAKDYDRHIFGNPINIWLRNVSISVMNLLFKSGDTVLELGCGSGTETLSLAKRGVKVIATDISKRMIEVLKAKAKKMEIDKNVVGIWSRPLDLKERLESLGNSKLDGAYSTYGAVNTEPRLGETLRDVHFLLKEKAPLLLGVWNKYCLYEMLGYTLKMKPGLAFARLRNPVPVGKSRFCVSTNAFSVGSLASMVDPYFELERVYGVVVTLPPSNLTKYLPGGRMFRLLKSIDLNLGRGFPMNRLGDHFLAVYRNKSNLNA
jgi:deazaflavin-dependent oxidoreductase (nitroreductase family)